MRMGSLQEDSNGVMEQLGVKEHKHKHKHKHKNKHKHKEKKRDRAEQESIAPGKAEGAGNHIKSACDSEPESGEICAADDVDTSVAIRSGEDKPEHSSKQYKSNNGTLQQDEQAVEECQLPVADKLSERSSKHARDVGMEASKKTSVNIVQQLVNDYDEFDDTPSLEPLKKRRLDDSSFVTNGKPSTKAQTESSDQDGTDRYKKKESRPTPDLPDASTKDSDKPRKADARDARHKIASEHPSSSPYRHASGDEHSDKARTSGEQRKDLRGHQSRGGQRDERPAGDWNRKLGDKLGREDKRDERKDRNDRGLREGVKDPQDREYGRNYHGRSKDREREREGYVDIRRGFAERTSRPDESRHSEREKERDRHRDRERERGSGRGGRDRGGRDYRDRDRDRRDEVGRSHKRSRSMERKDDAGERRSSKKYHAEAQEGMDDDIPMLLEQNDEEEELRRIEESRRRRQEILAKHQQQMAAATDAPAAATATQLSTLSTAPATPDPTSGISSPEPRPQGTPPKPSTPSYFVPEGTPEGDRLSSSDDENADGPVLDIWAPGEVGGDEATSIPPSAAPKAEQPSTAQEQLIHDAIKGGEQKGQEEEDDDDMFDVKDDEDDAAAVTAAAAAQPEAVRRPVQALANDAYDDAEGYYNFQVGELMNERYEVFSFNGKGVFSTVLRARDTMGRRDEQGNPPEVAVKMIRNNETMYKQAQLELHIGKQLAAADPDNRKHCVRIVSHFEYRSHMCMVFEPMDMNLRELTNKYGRNVGLNIKAVGLYASQLLVALRHMRKCNILHADIKPDNILVNHRRTKVKICDFGSAMFYGKDNEITPYLVSRFYRPPEVILGLKYDFAMDMWSIGCVLYELFTGKILFPGRTNNEMLKLMMDIKGPFNKKMVRKGQCTDEHFDGNLTFIYLEEDPVSKQEVRREVPNPTIKHNFTTLLARSAETDKARVSQLADLLERMFTLDPEKRMDPDAALRHPFIREYLPRKKDGSGK